jgi:hypothetical protein
MREKLRFLGLDVHAETIAVAVADPEGEVRSLGTIANREEYASEAPPPTRHSSANAGRERRCESESNRGVSYFSRDPNPSKRAAYIRRTMEKARRWAER